MTNIFPSPKNKIAISAIFFSITLLLACSKNGVDTSSPGPPVTGGDTTTVSLNPWYPGSSFFDKQYEFIVSTASGNILLDTMLSVNTSTPLSFKTTEELVDVTTIAHTDSIPHYLIKTYKGVNPSQWDSLNFGYGHFVDFVSTPYLEDTLHYYNLPKNHNSVAYFDAWVGSGSSGYTLTTDTMEVTYQRHPGAPAFLLFPTLNLYNLHNSVSTGERVDLSVMDTAISQMFVMPPQYKCTYVDLWGIIDTTDFSRSVNVYGSRIYFNYTGADIEYPTKYFQKYQLNMVASNGLDIDIYHFSYGDTVAYKFDFPEETDFTLNATQKDNFAVAFNNIQPAYYITKWESSDIRWLIYASPESSSLRPLSTINILKSRSHFLGGADVNNLGIKSFIFEIMNDVNYATYMGYNFNSKQRTKRIIYSSDQFIKTF